MYALYHRECARTQNPHGVELQLVGMQLAESMYTHLHPPTCIHQHVSGVQLAERQAIHTVAQ